ncbi:MAG: methylthioribulose 1-phosphate dehydratase [Gammaproteobacteria bacterium]|nr:methylthioribulose 1-phosphate dehydratase [Gammaproteobacteria bacterium]
MSEFQLRAQELIEAGQQLYRMGMVPATSGNFSARLADNMIAITVSGRHKGRLSEDDIMQVDAGGQSIDNRRPSAETLLHTYIYKRYPQTQVILHPHSVNATLLSRLTNEWLVLQDYEILKAFPGVDTHQSSVAVPVFDNDQNIERLAKKIDACLQTLDCAHGYLIRGHGFYTWGNSIEDAMRHVEAFEFLFDCELRLKGIQQ